MFIKRESIILIQGVTSMKTKIKLSLFLSAAITVLFSTGCEKPKLPADTKLFLVGVGPGDPDLASLRAVNVIKSADIIVCFSRLKKKFGDMIGGTETIEPPHGFWRNYGKKCSAFKGERENKCQKNITLRNTFITQVRENIKKGKVVAILTSGDPLIYGPWAWVLEEFEDINPTVVPGISCFNAGHAAMKKSPTSAPKTKSVILASNDWKGKTDTISKMAAHRASMVLFTMKAEFDFFISQLKKEYPLKTPVAVVMHAGYKKKEKVITGTLGTIKERVKERPFEYLIYVGDFITYKRKKK
jgi:precorrin-4 methylase